MNKTIHICRLVRDPDIRYSANEKHTCIASFTGAIDRRFKQENAEQTADFVPFKALGKTAEFIEKYVRKGTKVAIEGRLQSGSYTDKDGNKKYTLEVMVENIEFAESKSASGGNQNSTNNSNDFVPVEDAIDEELPFA